MEAARCWLVEVARCWLLAQMCWSVEVRWNQVAACLSLVESHLRHRHHLELVCMFLWGLG